MARDLYWSVPSGDFGDASNWIENGDTATTPPDAGSDTYFEGGGSVQVSVAGDAANSVDAVGTNVTFDLGGGTFAPGDAQFFGTVDLTDGTFDTAGGYFAVDDGALVIVNGGALVVENQFSMVDADVDVAGGSLISPGKIPGPSGAGSVIDGNVTIVQAGVVDLRNNGAGTASITPANTTAGAFGTVSVSTGAKLLADEIDLSQAALAITAGGIVQAANPMVSLASGSSVSGAGSVLATTGSSGSIQGSPLTVSQAGAVTFAGAGGIATTALDVNAGTIAAVGNLYLNGSNGSYTVENAGVIRAGTLALLGTLAAAGGGTVVQATTLDVGVGGSAKLQFSQGAGALVGQTPNSGSLVVGDSASANGLLIVDGASLAVSGNATVGSRGLGTLSLVNAAIASISGNLTFGATASAAGDVFVYSGSALTVGGTLAVGGGGSGTLAITGQGVVNALGPSGGVVIGSQSGGSGTVTVGAGTLAASSLGIGGSVLAQGGAGTLSLATGAAVTVGNDAAAWSGGSIALGGGMLTAANLRLASGSTLTGYGTVGGAVAANGSVLATGTQALTFLGPVTGNGTFELAQFSTLAFGASVAAGISIKFDAPAHLNLADPADMFGTLVNFAAGDQIDLINTVATQAVLSGNEIVVTDNGDLVADIATANLGDVTGFDVSSDNNGGTNISIGDAATGPAGTPSFPGAPLVTTVPGTLAAIAGAAMPVSGISIADPNATAGVTVTEMLTAGLGVLSANISAANGGGQVVSGDGGRALTISGTLAQVNADLGTLTYQAAAAGADTIAVNSGDSVGDSDGHVIPVTVQAGAASSLIGGGTVLPGDGGADTVISPAGNSTVTTAPAGSFVFLGAGAASVTSLGADTVVGGTGSATVSAATSSPLVFSLGGPIDFIAGGGASTVVAGGVSTTLFGGSGNTLLFSNGPTRYFGAGGVDTVVGLNGALTVGAGAGGGLFFGGTAGGNIIAAGPGNVTAFGGGAGDVLTATGAASDLFAGGVGAETLTGAGATGANTFFAGFGNETLIGGAGNTALVAGAGADFLAGGSGLTLFLFVNGRTVGAADVITGFDPTHDFAKLAGYGTSEASVLRNATVANGSSTITLSDGTRVTFAGVTQLDAGSFT